MKITKNRLKQIIKEELELAMDEAKLAPVSLVKGMVQKLRYPAHINSGGSYQKSTL